MARIRRPEVFRLGTCVLERAERRIPTRVVVSNRAANAERLRREQVELVHEQPFGQLQPRMDVVARDGVADRLDLELCGGSDHVPGALAVDFDVEGGGPRLVELVRRDEDTPRSSGVSARHRCERVALCLVAALVDGLYGVPSVL